MYDLESRVTDLEIQLSHQMKFVEELNSVIVLQQKKLDKVENVNNFLIENIKNSEGNGDFSSITNFDQKPPHY